MVDVPPITTRRLELVSISPTFVEALLAGQRAEAEAIAGFKLADGWPGPHAERGPREGVPSRGARNAGPPGLARPAGGAAHVQLAFAGRAEVPRARLRPGGGP